MKKDQHVTAMISRKKSNMEKYIRKASYMDVDEITVVDKFNPSDVEPLSVKDYYLEYLRFKHNELTDINLGVEVVLSSKFEEQIKTVIDEYPFDLVVGSMSLEDTTSASALEKFLKDVLKNIEKYKSYVDVLSLPKFSFDFTTFIENYAELIDQILEKLIENEIGIEINSTRFTSILQGILKRYRELGGTIITLGSYAEVDYDLSLYFEYVYNILESIGYKTISQFHNHVPEQIEIRKLMGGS